MSSELDLARDALDHGDAERALRHAWKASFAAAATDDEDTLDAVTEVAEAVRGRSDGHVREDAEQLATYAAYARDHPQRPHIGGITLRRDR